MAEDLCRNRPCRGRGWCSREKRQAAVQIVLLCVASCSWTLLLISLTLTTSASKPRHARKAIANSDPQWTEGGAEACEECLLRRGPPKTYWQVFERSLQQIAAALDRLDQPLAPPALRAQLQATRSLLRRLATILHMPLIINPETQQSRELSHEVILRAPGHVDGRLACPDQFMGPKAGYPHYHHGYMSINCSALPLKKVLTAVLWDIESEHLTHVLDDFNSIYPGLPVHLISDIEVKQMPNIITEHPTPTIGEGISRALHHVNTPYILLGPSLTEINNHSRLERLVWVAEWSGVWAAGGAGKGQNGHWRAGCLQALESEGQLMYSWGYTASLFECQLCHALHGPLVIRTEALRKLDWPKPDTSSELLFPSLFLGIHKGAESHKHGGAVCPDSMFMISSIEPPWDIIGDKFKRDQQLRKVATLWHSVAKQRRLARLRLPSGAIVNYPCDLLEGVRQQQSTRFSPTSADQDVTASWACQRRELKIILGDVLGVCSKLMEKCCLHEPTLSGKYENSV
ncbi:hypothetical protein SK128_006596 [Halocaridina rubra]|uniref:Uncharacterized protein n=1 Tax=Halocaridina rubra TaxID=373956 RepID=A0AAN8WFA2_HALRR